MTMLIMLRRVVLKEMLLLKSAKFLFVVLFSSPQQVYIKLKRIPQINAGLIIHNSGECFFNVSIILVSCKLKYLHKVKDLTY